MKNNIYSITKECELAGEYFTTFEIKNGDKTLIADSFDGINFSEDKAKKCIESLLGRINIYSLDNIKQIAKENDFLLEMNEDLIVANSPEYGEYVFEKYDNYFYKQLMEV